MGWRQPGHLTHRPSVRTFLVPASGPFSAAGPPASEEYSPSSRLNQDIPNPIVYGKGQPPAISHQLSARLCDRGNDLGLNSELARPVGPIHCLAGGREKKRKHGATINESSRTRW